MNLGRQHFHLYSIRQVVPGLSVVALAVSIRQSMNNQRRLPMTYPPIVFRTEQRDIHPLDHYPNASLHP